jgi:hypothetical protein
MSDNPRHVIGPEAWLLLPQTIFNGIVIILVAAGIMAIIAQSGNVSRTDQQIIDLDQRVTAITVRIDAEVLLGRAAIERQQTNIANIANLSTRVTSLEARLAEQDTYERHLEDKINEQLGRQDTGTNRK